VRYHSKDEWHSVNVSPHFDEAREFLSIVVEELESLELSSSFHAFRDIMETRMQNGTVRRFYARDRTRSPSQVEVGSAEQRMSPSAVIKNS